MWGKEEVEEGGVVGGIAGGREKARKRERQIDRRGERKGKSEREKRRGGELGGIERESKSKGVRVTDRGSKSAIRRVTNTTDQYPLQTNSRVLARLFSGTERVYWSSRRTETRFSSPQPFLLDSPVNPR